MFDFKPLSEKERIERELEDKRIKQATEEATERLKACLLSDTFREYKDELDKCYNDLIGTGIVIMHNTRNATDRLALYDMLFGRAEILGLLKKRINDGATA